jgi:serine/threonine-protein phosphatase PGAM5
MMFLCGAPAFAADVPAVRTLYLVRHGAYLPDRTADPNLGPGISTLGIAQARLTGARFRAMPVTFESVTSSALTRAKETAAIIHEQIGDTKTSASPLLNECTPPVAFALNESESALKACKQRLDSAFAHYFKPGRAGNSHEILVAHGNVIRYLVTKALGVDTRMWTGMSVAHASVTIIQVHANGAVGIIAVGDIGHIPANMQSWGDDADPNLARPDVRGFELRQR